MKPLWPACIRFWAGALAALLAGTSWVPCAAQKGKPLTVQPAIIQAATDGKVWGALVYASDSTSNTGLPQTDPPKDFKDLSKRLGKAFPFRHFEVIGQHSQDIFRQYESWVVPSKDLFLKIDSKGPAPGGGMNLHLQFWHEQQVLVKTDAVLRPRSPLFIGGPRWRGGRLIFVLVLRGPNGG